MRNRGTKCACAYSHVHVHGGVWAGHVDGRNINQGWAGSGLSAFAVPV